MNLPNKLTILRAIMIPFFLVFLYMSPGWSKWVALGIFIAASLTDMLDGKIARKYNLVTNLENSWILWQISCWYVRHS